jgi:hypothetical protein
MSIKHTKNLIEAESLLEQCLEAFNILPNRRINHSKYKDTYEIASQIDKYFKKNK